MEKDLGEFIRSGVNVESGEVYLPFVIQGMLHEQLARVMVIPANSHWFGVTYADDKEKAAKELAEMTQAGHYPSPLWPSAV